MRSRLANLWDQLRSSFWFVPLLMCCAAVVVSWMTLWVDQSERLQWARTVPWIGAGTAEEARHALSTVATTVATIAGVVFSITMVVLALASAQFGPRVLRQFMRDLSTQMTLGMFVGTFTFCLLVLRAMGPLQQRYGDVLDVSVSFAIILGLISIGMLVVFIHHVAASIQAANVVAKLNCETEAVIAANYPARGEDKWAAEAPAEFVTRGSVAVQWERTSAYIQAISVESLVQMAERHDIQIKLVRRAGQFVISGEPIAFVNPGSRLSSKLAARIRDAFEAGAQRTQSQDVEFGIDQMVQVALRALSPSLNDPATANICIDYLASAMCYVAQRQLGDGHLQDRTGCVRVFAGTVEFSGLLDAAFNEIRQNAGTQVSVFMRLIENLGRIASLARTEEQRRAIKRHLDLVLTGARSLSFAESDLNEIVDRYTEASAALPGSGLPGEQAA